MAQPFQTIAFTSAQPYEVIYRQQKTLVEERIAEAIPDTLLLGEHEHIITLGRGSQEKNLLETTGIPVIEIERGGDVTYHGPGQLVGYPIIQLLPEERDLHRYLRNLEDVLIQTLALYGLEGSRKPGWTGVWVGDQKIASIGVAVKKWVTYHGFALNVSTDLDYFNRVHPCGLPATVMTSMEALLRKEVPIDMLEKQIIEAFSAVFKRNPFPALITND